MKKTTLNVRGEVIDAALAEKYLAKNIKNRPLRESHVNDLVQAILRGNWKPGSDCIVFDRAGNMLNGQHRLTAVIQANQIKPGISIECMVRRNASSEEAFALDQGYVRKASDIINMHGGFGRLNDEQAAALKLVLANGSSKTASSRLSALVLTDAVKKYRKSIDFVYALLPDGKNFKGSPFAAACISAHYCSVDEKKLKYAIQMVTSPTGISDAVERNELLIGYQSLETLRSILLGGSVNWTGERFRSYQKVIYLLYSFFNGEIVRQVDEKKVGGIWVTEKTDKPEKKPFVLKSALLIPLRKYVRTLKPGQVVTMAEIVAGMQKYNTGGPLGMPASLANSMSAHLRNGLTISDIGVITANKDKNRLRVHSYVFTK
jgi:hypothetical protein